jgi:hypothetical protein
VIFLHASELNRANTLPLYQLFPDMITTKLRSRLETTAATPINGSGSCNPIPIFRIVFCSMINTRATPKLGAGHRDVERAGIVVRDLQFPEPKSIADLMTLL